VIDIVGDMYDIVGAKSSVSSQMARKSLPAWMARASGVVESMPTGKTVLSEQTGIPRMLPLPIPSTIVNPAATVPITAAPQIPIRAERLVLTSTATPSNVSVQATVGVIPQAASAGFTPLDVYRPNAFDVRLNGNTLNVGQLFTLNATNNGGVAETIGGAVIGTSLQP